MKLTKWFDGRKFVPAHVGVYECGGGYFRYWNGESWSFRQKTANEAEKWRGIRSIWEKIDWRGLAENPNDDQKV